MKRYLVILSIGFCSLILAQGLSAQTGETARDRINRRQQQQQKKSNAQLTIRAENMNKDQTQDIEGVVWMREIYRVLDLNKDQNAALYYPTTPRDGKMNLFSLIMKLFLNNDITTYVYDVHSGLEAFDDDKKLDVKKFLESHSIIYREENGQIIVEDYDMYANEIQGYNVKEVWFFDKNNSVVDTKIVALSPILYVQDDYSADKTGYPLFWVKYEDIRPYAARMPIMVSNLNNAQNQTIDDYFRKRSYQGDIYRTTNMQNRPLATSGMPADSLKKEQQKIENQLIEFNKRLWMQTDSTKAEVTKADKKDKKEKDEEKESDVKKRENRKVDKNSSKSGGSKQKSAPKASMRNRRNR
ncbi:gliding motility associated protein GldN [Dysgonomonas sp. PH5-45]|uniref:type IX secretion system ring protein PorN/GldN n=1 Tax=unclassified Dysgonomonas TaxID=2630389 RepID=UPI002476EA1F|nr:MULTISPECIES: gliding motility protein GldN [unclassified Dysgonomonas]MDH6353818.1 gliding motility associated protein GldN [Dysgonomonas sp. PH5-45]MDH6386720.1 gliding motility associated protein GldN [Dysgonomonas sp. PH5-37]